MNSGTTLTVHGGVDVEKVTVGVHGRHAEVAGYLVEGVGDQCGQVIEAADGGEAVTD